ncbi:uncharacterized protein LOC117783905 [Drosophila innubila]|uniref:uncharacterized protein LOC117783905 n=1 Tax=Drosophila innubila TaxID=198719 RepID=UPI00148DDD84|nr:uncharacterized protein LOC117783905 [Drosophila innubila]
MDFEGENTYEDFFDKMHSNDGTRNLRQIFEDDDKPLQSESSNLRYQPHSSSHKQQQEKHKTKPVTSTARNKPETKSLDSWSTVVAKVANGYNGSENMGRVGVALSRNGAGAAKLVIYKSRNHLLSTLLLTKSIMSSVPRDGTSNVILRESYMQFYDDEQHFWSLRFEFAADEEEFTEALLNLGLPIEQMTNEDSKVVTPATSTPLPQLQPQPQPLPRQMHKSPLASARDNEAVSSYDSESESTQSTEDNISTQRSKLNTKALVPLGTSSSIILADMSPQKSSNKLEAYLNEQRATGHAMDKKMDTILQAMCRLTSGHSVQLSDAGDSTPGSAAEQPDIKKMDSLLQAMGRLNNSSIHQLSDTTSTIQTSTDNEDELLELEQKLLDFKKQNRILIKSLKAREQALAELRASTCALCEQLLSQNNDLKNQNAALMTAMTAQVNGGDNSAASLTATSCTNCDKYVCKISSLERRVSILQSALLNFPNLDSKVTSTASASAGASAKTGSPPLC